MKKLILIVFALLITSSLAFSQSIQSGSWFAGVGEGFTLDKGTGERVVTISIEFTKPFEKKPTIIFSVNRLDAEKTTNLRYNIEATTVTRDGFTLKISTWSDTKIYGIGGFWLALPQ